MNRPNGREQADALARLAEPWKPSELAGFRVGDLCDVPSLGRCRITALIPPSLVELQTEQGGRCKCGWRVIQKVSARPPTQLARNKAQTRHHDR